jgi:hypothetical protein
MEVMSISRNEPPPALGPNTSDDAKRCADTHNMHASAGSVRKWVAIRLSDGGTDGVVYDHRRDAVKHQLSPEYCAYMQIINGPMTVRNAQDFLDFYRLAYDSGLRVTDPEDAHPIMPLEYASRPQF